MRLDLQPVYARNRPAWTVALTPAAPVVHMDAFDRPLDLSLNFARAQKVHLGRIAIASMANPFVIAITAAAKIVLLAQRGD